MLKKIIFNLFLVLLLFIVLEVYCYNIARKENEVFKQKIGNKNYTTKYEILADFKLSPARKSFEWNTNKKPILWFGCSFAEGEGLKDNQTPCYKISKLTDRSCINKSKGATGTQFVYYQLLNDDFFVQNPNAEYIIYVFIYNHIQRLYNYQVNPLINMFNLRYSVKNGKLQEIKPIFKPFYSFFFVKRFLNKKIKEQTKQEEIDYALFNELLLKSKEITSKKYPNSKFILVEFPDLSEKELPQYELETLKNMGITVIRVKDIVKNIDISNKKYWLDDNIHPSEQLWDLILPDIVQRFLDSV